MKKILVTGESSYIGTSFIKYIKDHYKKDYYIDNISVRGNKWKTYDFSLYDVVIHVAGIAHVKETNDNRDLYYLVNRDLTLEVAKKAKEDKVSQFVFLSSMSVYGLSQGVINEYTPTIPKCAYGKSKLEGEILLRRLEDHSFKVVIIRPPMVYGPGCLGNYSKLSKVAKITPLFPKIDNKRSMIFVDNLSLFIINLIKSGNKGVFHPQNHETTNISELVKLVSNLEGKKIYLTKIFNPFINGLMGVPTICKVFGNLTYEFSSNHVCDEGQYIGLRDSIKLTEAANG